MTRAIAVGEQDFVKIRENNYFYIDKSGFIADWWKGADNTTAVMRPRRFGKTLNMSMLKSFFEIGADVSLFEGLYIATPETLVLTHTSEGAIGITTRKDESLKQLQEELHALGVEEEQIRPIPMYITYKHDADEEVRVKQRIVPTRKRDKSNDKFRISLLVNIILGILVLAMFGITLKSDNPNILNYRKAIINEYAAWEQELTEREEQIRQKEAELGIN